MQKSGKQRPEEIEIKFGIKNFGKTPADSIYIRDSCIIASTRKDFIFPQIPVDTYKGRWAMSPNQVIYCVNPITKKQWSGVSMAMPDCLFVVLLYTKTFTGKQSIQQVLPTKSNPIHLFQLEQIIT